jgi:hypothetical protein
LGVAAHQKLNIQTAQSLTQYVEEPIVIDVSVCDLDVLDEGLISDKFLLQQHLLIILAMDRGMDSPSVQDGVLQSSQW